jgi:regulator of protease activity HflC (stomatin/prohibitin superfamily)
MFGMRYAKFEPNVFVLKYRRGKIVKEGAGIALWYFAPTTSLMAVPVTSSEVPFIFDEVTADFQALTVQGKVIYKISDPKKTAQLLNFTLDAAGRRYISDDPEKLPARVMNIVQVLTKIEIAALPLKKALIASEVLAKKIFQELQANPEINSLGLQILGVSILAILPNKETARALEATIREQILKEADDAIYSRRNASVEQERSIKENELNTEILVENKKRQIRETQMEAERSIQEKQHKLKEEEMKSKINLEEKNKDLVELEVANSRAESDAKAYAIASAMKALEKVNPDVIQSLAGVGMKPEQLIAAAFQTIAEKADKIGQLNISPDLLKQLLNNEE